MSSSTWSALSDVQRQAVSHRDGPHAGSGRPGFRKDPRSDLAGPVSDRGLSHQSRRNSGYHLYKGGGPGDEGPVPAHDGSGGHEGVLWHLSRGLFSDSEAGVRLPLGKHPPGGGKIPFPAGCGPEAEAGAGRRGGAFIGHRLGDQPGEK